MLLSAWLCAMQAIARDTLADAHTHYKWSQSELTSPQQVLEILRAREIEMAVVIGTPAEFALRVRRLDPERIVALWSPYRIPGDWSRWAFDPDVPQRARAALESGDYQGIGELHLVGGFTPRSDSPVIRELLALAGEFSVPVLIHTEFSSNRYLLDLCRAHPRVRIAWAHAGAILPVSSVAEVLEACPNVWPELSARDPWRFVGNPITDEQGRLDPEWKRLIETHADRMMIGSDPVWPVEQLDGWDRADSGWREYGRFIDFHRGWLDQLDAADATRIGRDNAMRLYRPRPLRRDRSPDPR